jgi:hypothetical protein
VYLGERAYVSANVHVLVARVCVCVYVCVCVRVRVCVTLH